MFKQNFLAIFFLSMLVFSGKASAQSDCDTGPPAKKLMQERSGEYRFENENAQIKIPKDTVFLDAKDAQMFARYTLGWEECSVRTLVGIITPKKERQKPATQDLEHNGQIFIYYKPGLIEIEDVISADYDSMVDQVRRSYEQGDKLRAADSRQQINVAGWGIPPGLHGTNLISWGLNILEGNELRSQTIEVKAVKLGRKGYFRFQMTTPVLQMDEFHKHILAAGNALSFDKGLDYDSRVVGPEEPMLMTIGDLIANDLQATRATPLTWGNYLKATIFAAFHHFAFYFVEILAFFTVGSIVFFIRWYSGRKKVAARGSEDDDTGDTQPRRRAAALLNGIPVPEQRR